MVSLKFTYSFIYIILFTVLTTVCRAEHYQESGILKGKIDIDSTWSSKIYLSYIPSFEEMYSMSTEMIIASSDITPEGFFQFNLGYLPKEDQLYRLHIVKKTDSKLSLIIGGKNENYLLFTAHKNSIIELSIGSTSPPFKGSKFMKDEINIAFQKITRLIKKNDSLASVSNAYKRKFLNENLKLQLLKIADTSSNALVSMYAIYQSDFEVDFAKNKAFYDSFRAKWEGTKNGYFKNFNAKVSEKQPDVFYFEILLGVFCLALGFFIGKYVPGRKHNLQKLSVQERKVMVMLKKGASNKEISEEFNIGISTVKSHVSSILSKMNVKSRKELMGLK